MEHMVDSTVWCILEWKVTKEIKPFFKNVTNGKIEKLWEYNRLLIFKARVAR